MTGARTTAASPTALIAEDEPLLAAALQKALAIAWPELQVIAVARDGTSAVEQALARTPNVLFLDIRMPGQSGIDTAADIADGWDTHAPGKPFPALVFVTAYDQYAVQAFEARAVDYLLKPLQMPRLGETVARLQRLLASRRPAAAASAGDAGPATALEQTLAQLRQLLAAPTGPAPAPAPLRMLTASIGPVIHMVPLDEVLLFEATDKYVRVLTADREYLIRTPLRELLPLLDGNRFWQVHRAHVVRADAVDTVTRDAHGKLWLRLRGRTNERVAVSRLYAHLLKAM